MKIAVIGAGNGGHAIAGYLAIQGHRVSLFDRCQEVVDKIVDKGGITLSGRLDGFGRIYHASTNLSLEIKGADIIMVVTTATAHCELACQMCKFLEDGQIVILNPGRTGGALEFATVLREEGLKKRIYLAEAQTLMYACRVSEIGHVHVIGVKDKVYLSATPSSDIDYILKRIKPIYKCFFSVKNVLHTSFENIGAVFHPCVILFNAAAIERGAKFYFYREMTDAVAHFIEEFDNERLLVGRAYGVPLVSAKDWVSYAYEGVQGNTLCEKMRNNPAYYDILAPTSIDCRQLSEDIPMGIVPLLEFGKLAGVPMPLFESVLAICSRLLNKDFRTTGRNFRKLGLDQCRSVEDILNFIGK